MDDCNAGLRRCVGRTQASGQCCLFFLNNQCVDSCPSSLMANPTTFDCGEHHVLKLSNQLFGLFL